MKILAVDTATSSLSVAISDNGCLIAEQILVRKESHSKYLMDVIQYVIESAGLVISEIDGFAVTRGPGSFTGLRIGVSAVKGLAFGMDKPVVSISALEVLAKPFCTSMYPVCSMIDARRGEVYYSFYQFQNGHPTRNSEEKVDKPENIVNHLKQTVLFVGSGQLVYRDTILKFTDQKALFAANDMNIIRAGTLACMAHDRFVEGDTDDLGTFRPRYIRKSDAELNFRK